MGLVTERIYYTDPLALEFTASVLETDPTGTRVVLDRTAFYPTSGGQPNDIGEINGIPVTDVVHEEDRIVHVLAAPLGPADSVQGIVDRARRFDHMQQHSGQHLLSAVFAELYGHHTVSFHLGTESSTIDLAVAALEPAEIRSAEERANAIVSENRPLSVSFENASQVQGLRKESGREGTLRIVTIESCDRSACGGTHVRATGEIGVITIRKVEKMRGNARVEFLCGQRAVKKARADFETLTQVARLFSCSFEETPANVSSLLEQVKDAEKARRKLAVEMAGYRGKTLYEACLFDDQGRKRHIERTTSAPGDETRALAQSFCAQPGAIFIAASSNPPAVMLAAGADVGIHAGNVLKELLAAAGGRGGGSAQNAQGSLPSAEALEVLLAKLAHL